MCVGGALWFGGFCSLLEHSSVSDVSSRCPCLRVRDLFSSSDLSLCLSLAFDHLLEFFYSFLFIFFSLRLLCVCVIKAHIKGEIEDHVCFEDRWIVASWCDE
jgi:hypothetical protein